MFAAVLAGGMLQGCGQVQSAKDWWAQQTPAEKAALIVAGVHTTCGVSIKVADVTSAVTQDPVATTVDGTIKAICDQIDVAGKIQALTPSECVATVNGVCIHKDG